MGKIYVVIINKLKSVEENYPLLLNAAGKRLSDVIKQIIDKNLTENELYKKLIVLNYFIHYKDVRYMSELNPILPKEVKENIRMAVDELGVKTVVEAVGLKKVIDEFGLKKVIDEFGLKKVIDEFGIDSIVENVDDLDALKEVIEKIREKRKRQSKSNL